MKIIIDEKDFSRLKPSTRDDLLATILGTTSNNRPRETKDFLWEGRVDLTPSQVAEFIEGCAPETVQGLKVIAEEGPVIAANLLDRVGIENYAHFQGRTTKRARTVTGVKDAYLLAWDDWASEDNQQYGCGHYAVTVPTFDALRAYFDF